MGTAFNPTTIASGFRDTDRWDTILNDIKTELNNMLNRTGLAPNAMEADLDMGTFTLLNVEEGINGSDGVNLNQVTNVATSIANTIVNSAIAGAGTPSSGTTFDPITVNYGLAVGSQGAATRTEFDANTLFGITSFNGLTVAVNGVIQHPNTYSVTDDTLITFSESLNVDSDILFIFGDLSPTPVFSNANATLTETASTATAGQTVFTAPTYIIGANQLMVSIDGLLQSITQGDYTETSTTSITLDESMVGGEIIVIRNITGV